MPTYRYRTEGVPGRAAAAFSPLPTTNPIASSWGLVHVVGSPSTTKVPVAPLQSIAGSDRGGWVATGKPGDNAPDYILPSLYWPGPPTPQMARHTSTNEIPIPAISSSQPYAPASATAPGTAVTPAVVQRARRMGGRLVQAWPKVASFWPTFGSGVNNQANSG